MNRRRIFSVHILLTPGNRKRAAIFNRCDSDGQNTKSREYSIDRHPRLFNVLLDLELSHKAQYIYYNFDWLSGRHSRGPLLYVAINIPGWPPRPPAPTPDYHMPGYFDEWEATEWD